MGELTDALFVILAFSLVFLSVSVVLIGNPVRSTFLLIFSFVPTTGIYILLHAPFVGVLQILVYSGAILVLFTFVVMMINPAPFLSEEQAAAESSNTREKLRVLVLVGPSCALLYALIVNALPDAEITGAGEPPAEFGSILSLGRLLFADGVESPYFVSFQLTAFLILAGIVAAVNLAKPRPAPDEEADR